MRFIIRSHRQISTSNQAVTIGRQTLFWQMLFWLKFTSTDTSLCFTFTFTRGQQFHV